MTTKIRKKNTPLENLNNAIFILWLFFGGPLLFILTVGLSLYLLFINLAVNLVLVIFYKIYQKNGKCRTPLIITRIIAIVLVFISISIPFIPASCCYTKQMYPIQRFTYVHGVRQSANEILPKKLPQNISDYYFRTQLNFPAQDYSPYSYLSFYTDKDSIAEMRPDSAGDGVEVVCARNYNFIISGHEAVLNALTNGASFVCAKLPTLELAQIESKVASSSLDGMKGFERLGGFTYPSYPEI
jgi:hypothetical protein